MVFLLIIGIVLLFGLLTYLIDREGTSILLSYDKDKSSLLAYDIVREIRELMVVDKTPAGIRKLVSDHTVPGEINAALFKGNGTLYAGETTQQVPADIFTSQRETTVRNGDHLLFFIPLLNEKRCQGCHQPNKTVIGVLMVDVTTGKMHAVLNEFRLSMMFASLLVAALGSLGLIVILRQMVFSPLSALRNAAEHIGGGDLSHRVATDRQDEFGSLALIFNNMAESIENSVTMLDSAVKRRTMELEVVANLSVEVFRGDRTLDASFEVYLDAIMNRLGFRHTSLFLVARETGVLIQQCTKGAPRELFPSGISLTGENVISTAVLDAKPVILNAEELGFTDTARHVVVVPIISHQRRRCREINTCTFISCPAFSSADERCWLVDDTLCRSRHAAIGSKKLNGCILCAAFPIYGMLICGTDDIKMLTDSMLHSLEILSSELASAIETHRLMNEKKEYIEKLVQVHDLSVQKMTTLELPSLAQFIVSSVTPIVNMDAAILWLKTGKELVLSSSFGIEFPKEAYDDFHDNKTLIPPSVLSDDGIIGRSLALKRLVESTEFAMRGTLGWFMEQTGFTYMVSAPLIFQDHEQGCITLFRKLDFPMSESERAILDLLAHQTSASLHAVSLYKNLISSEEKYRELMSKAGDGIALLASDGTFIELNSKAMEILRYPDDSIVGRPYSILIDHEHMGRASDSFREIVRNGSGVITNLLIVRGDGSGAYIDISASIVTVKGKPIVQAIFRDVSERREIDSALQRLNAEVHGVSSEALLRTLTLSLAESLGMAFVEIGELTSDRKHVRTIAACADGRIIENFTYALEKTPCDNVLDRKFCLYSEQVKNLFPDDLMLADMGAESYMGLPLFATDGKPIGIMAALDRKPMSDHQLKSVIFQMYSVRAASELQRMHTDMRLRAEKDFSEAVFDSAASGIMVISKDGQVLKINRAGAHILGIQAEHVIGREVDSMYPELSRFLLLQPSIGREIEVETADNRTVPIGFTNSLLASTGDSDGSIIVMFRDLSEIKRLQEELRRKDHFETMGKVVSGVAHEVRNPLFGISSIGQILERENNNPQHQVLISAMLKECERMKNLIDELLLYTRPARLDIRKIELGILLMDLEHHIESKKGPLSFSVTVPQSLTISVDRDKFTQILLNIINNALEAAQTSVTLSACQTVDAAEIRIRDDGPGIKPKNMEKIFEPFFTTKKGGSGLGLPICKKLMEDHGGSLEIISGDQGGTEVILRLRT